MKIRFAEWICNCKEKQNLYLRKVALLLETGTTKLSKIEKELQQLKREQITVLSEIFKVSRNELIMLLSVDQIYAVVKDEKLANEAMQMAEKNINIKKHKK